MNLDYVTFKSLFIKNAETPCTHSTEHSKAGCKNILSLENLDKSIGHCISGFCEGGHGGDAVGFDSKVILMHFHPEEPVLAPVGTPGVAAHPEFGFRGLIKAPADHRDFVVDPGPIVLLGVDAALVGVKALGGIDTACNGAILEELSLHLVCPLYRVVL